MTIWLNPEQVSERTGISIRGLAELRYQRKRFSFYKPNRTTVLYDQAEIDLGIQQSKVAAQ